MSDNTNNDENSRLQATSPRLIRHSPFAIFRTGGERQVCAVALSDMSAMA